MLDLPEPYAKESEAWRVPLSKVAQGRSGALQDEAKAARALLYDYHRGIWTALDPAEVRRLLLLTAAGADAAEVQSTLTGGPRTKLVHRAAGAGMALWFHDREHASARGQYGPDDPHWTETAESRREYTRQEWAARPVEPHCQPTEVRSLP